MATVPTAVLDHWHEKPLVVDITDFAARSPPAGTVLVGNSQRLQKQRSSPVFSPDRFDDIAAAGAAREPHAPTIRFNERPVVLSFSPISVATTEIDRNDSRSPVVAPVPASRAPSRAVKWMAAVTVQRAYRRRARRLVIASERARHGSASPALTTNVPAQGSLADGSVSVHTGAALSRQREARRAAALRAVARRQAQPEPIPPAVHSFPPKPLVRSSSCNTGRLVGCSSRTLVEAHFESGPLGLRIAEYARPGCEGDLLRVEEIQPGSAAARVPELCVGVALLKINGADVRYSGYTCRAEAQDGNNSRWRLGKTRSSSISDEASWFDTVMERMAQRPLTLMFVADQESARSTQSAPVPSNFVAMWQDSQLTPMSATEATTPPPPSPARPFEVRMEHETQGSVGASTSPDAYVPTQKNRSRKTASGCCAARPAHSSRGE
eukprot:COSAG02_NODE_1463_length_12488_cov_7.312591_8_plen_438_part_00